MLRFLVKHASHAVYEAGDAITAKPITTKGFIPRMYTGFFLENQQLGYMKWQHKRPSLAGEANSTVSLKKSVNSTSVL